MEVHGPIIEAMQKFKGWEESHKSVSEFNQALNGKFFGSPLVPFETLEGSRKNLILFPRGHLKSTVATIAHSIQWILNYPNIRILVTTATEDLARDFLLGIKSAFTSNENLRMLFPEFCTQGELGSGERFTIPCRNDSNKFFGQGGKEPTIRTSTVGSAITGYHGDIQKSDDLVEKQNSSTPRGIEDVKWHFGNMHPLLETYANPGGDPLVGWVDLIGTPWDFSDLYQTLQDAEDKLPEDRKSWNIVRRSAAPNWPAGPFLWPERVGYKALKAIEDDPTKGPAVLSAQYLMNPIVAGQGLINDVNQIVFTPRKVMDEILPRLSLYAAMDLAGMDPDARGNDNDYTCLMVGGFNRDGRLYIPFVMHGRPTPEEAIDWIFEAFRIYPGIIKLKMEKEAHSRVLGTFLKQRMARAGKYLPIQAEPRNNQQSKKDKIRGLQPWFSSGNIRFADDLSCRTHLVNEIKGFPKFRHDDILDCATDIMFEGRDINLSVMGREKTPLEQSEVNYLANPTPLAAMRMKADQFFQRNEESQDVSLVTGW